jgi:hypothetical protein
MLSTLAFFENPLPGVLVPNECTIWIQSDVEDIFGRVLQYMYN